MQNLGAGEISTSHDSEALVIGLALLSTGGGGLPERGRIYLTALLEEFGKIQWVPLQSLDREQHTCTVFGVGSVAPHEPLSEAEAVARGFRGERYPRPGVRAVRELTRNTGWDICGIVPFELGGFNTTVAIDAAVRLGIPLIDGDYIGRALPEISQSLPAALGYDAHPLAVCDNWGTSLMLTDCPSVAVTETVGKMISIVTKTPLFTATCAIAGFALTAGQAASALVPGSLSRALDIGRRILHARQGSGDPVQAAAVACGGTVVFQGEVTSVDWEDAQGYMTGTAAVTGYGCFTGAVARLWFRNENHILWIDDGPAATSPDLIAVVSSESAEPLVNTSLKAGQPVALLAMPCDPRYRAEELLNLTEPRHYGYDVPYTSVTSSAGAVGSGSGQVR